MNEQNKISCQSAVLAMKTYHRLPVMFEFKEIMKIGILAGLTIGILVLAALEAVHLLSWLL